MDESEQGKSKTKTKCDKKYFSCQHNWTLRLKWSHFCFKTAISVTIFFLQLRSVLFVHLFILDIPLCLWSCFNFSICKDNTRDNTCDSVTADWFSVRCWCVCMFKLCFIDNITLTDSDAVCASVGGWLHLSHLLHVEQTPHRSLSVFV